MLLQISKQNLEEGEEECLIFLLMFGIHLLWQIQYQRDI